MNNVKKNDIPANNYDQPNSLIELLIKNIPANNKLIIPYFI
jgi:hypothetical protein